MFERCVVLGLSCTTHWKFRQVIKPGPYIGEAYMGRDKTHTQAINMHSQFPNAREVELEPLGRRGEREEECPVREGPTQPFSHYFAFLPPFKNQYQTTWAIGSYHKD